jgi:hypothetical protein
VKQRKRLLVAALACLMCRTDVFIPKIIAKAGKQTPR